jgi:very-short-patch-repair endonuclease
MSNLLTGHPVSLEWDISKNIISIENITLGSNRKVWWICSREHSWEASVVSRCASSNGCPMCSGRFAIVGETDLATTNPDIAKQWHPTKNDGLLSSQIKAGSGRKVWWLGDCGHSWQAAPCMRTGPLNKTKCSICAGKTIISGVNDLATIAPHLIVEWDYEKNNLDPSKLSPGSHLSAWWECRNGHSWSTQIKSRALIGNGCSACSSAVSGLELELRGFIESLGVSCTYNTRGLIPPYEIDIYCEDLKVAIEFNGVYWHSESMGKDKNYHWNKYDACKSLGVQLIQVWEDDWLYKRDIVEEMLRHKLGKSIKYVGARTLKISRLEVFEARAFLKSHHLQGFRGATAHYGLKSTLDDKIMAVLSWSTSERVGDVVRYSAAGNVQGGFQRLLAYAINSSEDVYRVKSYVDNDYGTGGVYAKAGFTLKSDKIPSYGYFKRGSRNREHRLNYSPSAIRKKAETSSSILYHENMTERELAALNGLTRVWTSGNSLWEKYL